MSFLSEVLQKLFSKLQTASDESLLTLTLNGRPHIQLIEAIVNTIWGVSGGLTQVKRRP